MAERDSTNPLLYMILLLLVANLAFTASLWLTRDEQPAEPQSTVADLPSYADDKTLSELGRRIQLLYNAGDAKAFYSEFDELAKVQFTQEDLTNQLGQFSKLVGQIESSAFSHHEASRYGNYPAYLLHYKVRLVGGPFTSGTMKLSVIDRGNAFGLMGFNISGGSGGS